MSSAVNATLSGLEMLAIKSNKSMQSRKEQSDPVAVCGFESPSNGMGYSNMSSMLSIPEVGVVDKKVTRDEERGDFVENRVQQPEYYTCNITLSANDWDDGASVSSYRLYRTVDTAASSGSIQSIPELILTHRNNNSIHISCPLSFSETRVIVSIIIIILYLVQ